MTIRPRRWIYIPWTVKLTWKFSSAPLHKKRAHRTSRVYYLPVRRPYSPINVSSWVSIPISDDPSLCYINKFLEITLHGVDLQSHTWHEQYYPRTHSHVGRHVQCGVFIKGTEMRRHGRSLRYYSADHSVTFSIHPRRARSTAVADLCWGQGEPTIT